MVVVGLTISMHFQQFEILKFQNLVSSAFAWPLIPTLIIWSRFLWNAPPSWKILATGLYHDVQISNYIAEMLQLFTSSFEIWSLSFNHLLPAISTPFPFFSATNLHPDLPVEITVRQNCKTIPCFTVLAAGPSELHRELEIELETPNFFSYWVGTQSTLWKTVRVKKKTTQLE